MVVDGIASAEPPTAGRQPTGLPPSPVRVLPEVLERLRPVGPGSNCRCSSAVMPEAANSGVHPRTPHPAGDHGSPQTDDRPRRGTWTGCHASPPPPRCSTRPTAWNPTTLAASAPARTFCATSTRSSIEMAPTRWPMSLATGDVSLERHASGRGPDETTRRRVTCEPPLYSSVAGPGGRAESRPELRTGQWNVAEGQSGRECALETQIANSGLGSSRETTSMSLFRARLSATYRRQRAFSLSGNVCLLQGVTITLSHSSPLAL